MSPTNFVNPPALRDFIDRDMKLFRGGMKLNNMALTTEMSNDNNDKIYKQNKIRNSIHSKLYGKIFSFTIFFYLTLFSTFLLNFVEGMIDLPFCTQTQACAAEISQFPLISETVGNMIDIDGSGQNPYQGGSGQEIESFPFYDEFVTQSTIFDYGAEADLQQTQICRCPNTQETEEYVNECNFLSNDNIINIDRTLRLTFCQPVRELFKIKCAGRRALIRIIGEVDIKTSENIASVNDTAVFCNCDSETGGTFRRVNIEPWLDKYAFSYRCVWKPS